jgi:ABC-type nitrate/sulfonate/bicarbonate transport system permease component
MTATDSTQEPLVAITGAERSARRFWRPRLALLIKILSVLAFLALWTAATELGWVSPIFLPSPAAVAGRPTN